MKKIIFYPIALGYLFMLAAPPVQAKGLKSDARDFVANFFDIDHYEQIMRFREKLLRILHGDPIAQSKDRKGHFNFEGNLLSAVQLKAYENALEAQRSDLDASEYLKNNTLLENALKIVKEEFKNAAEQFKDDVKRSKPIMTTLIKESLAARNRQDSILLVWAENKDHHNDERLFEESIKSHHDFVSFGQDLYNFLGDMLDSFPEISQQYDQRKQKFHKLNQVYLQTATKSEKPHQFLIWVKNNYLDKLKIEDITIDKIQELEKSFKNQI